MRPDPKSAAVADAILELGTRKSRVRPTSLQLVSALLAFHHPLLSENDENELLDALRRFERTLPTAFYSEALIEIASDNQLDRPNKTINHKPRPITHLF